MSDKLLREDRNDLERGRFREEEEWSPHWLGWGMETQRVGRER